MNPQHHDSRLADLLSAEATQGLSPAEAIELEALISAAPDVARDSLERAAAAVHIALSPPPEDLPPSVAENLHRAAVALALTPAALPAPEPIKSGRDTRSVWTMWAGWIVAAGLAGLLVYTNGSMTEVKPTPIEIRRAQLLEDPEAHAVTFIDKKNSAGTIVWSDAKQEGYLEIRGLRPIDPKAGTYQLWIVDGARTAPNHKQPVDGGVFQVKPDGTALVQIQRPIQVKSAAAFAITLEKDPDGVVVSTEEHLVVLTPKNG
jgi:hypothetical protein